jgi:hypothetical protein
MIGVIFLSALMVLVGVHYWNDNTMQVSVDLQEVLQSSTTSRSALDCSKPPPEKTLAFQQSLGFFDDIDDQEWIDLFQTPARNADHYANPHNPNVGSDKAAFWNFMNQEPVMSCPHLKKVGGLGDGPKFVRNIFVEYDTIDVLRVLKLCLYVFNYEYGSHTHSHFL